MATEKVKRRLNQKKYNKFSKISDSIFDKQFISEAELDYHEFGVINIYEIEKILNDFLEDCHIQKLKNVLVITGKGQVVKPYVQKFLKSHKFVGSFKTAGYFNGQSGAFEVTLIG